MDSGNKIPISDAVILRTILINSFKEAFESALEQYNIKGDIAKEFRKIYYGGNDGKDNENL